MTSKEAGDVEVEIGDERAVFGAGGLVLVPAMVRTRSATSAGTRARVVGFFSSNRVAAIADEILQPIGSRVIGSPPQEIAGAVWSQPTDGVNRLEERSPGGFLSPRAARLSLQKAIQV